MGRVAVDVEAGHELRSVISLPPKEAIEWFRAKRIVSPSQFRKLADSAKQRAFSIAGLNHQYGLTEAHRVLGEAIEAGTSQRVAVAQLRDVFRRVGLTGKRHHLDLVFRTNVLSAYQAGRFAQLRRVTKSRPFWRYRTVGDSRVRESHRAMDGRIYPADDPVWSSWYPPNGFQCRCTVESLSAADMKREKLEPEGGAPGVDPDRGWSHSPATDEDARKRVQAVMRKTRSLRVLKPPTLAKKGKAPYVDAGDLSPGDLSRKRELLRSAAGLTSRELDVLVARGRFSVEQFAKLPAGSIQTRVPVPSQFVDGLEQLLAGTGANPRTAGFLRGLRVVPRTWFDPRAASATRLETVAIQGGSGGTDLVAVVTAKPDQLAQLAGVAARSEAGQAGAIRRAVDVSDAVIRGARSTPAGWRKAVLNRKGDVTRLTRHGIRGYAHEKVHVTEAKWRDIP